MPFVVAFRARRTRRSCSSSMNAVDGVVISPKHIGHRHRVSFPNRVAFQVGLPASSPRLLFFHIALDLQTPEFPIVSPVQQIRRRITKIPYVTEENLSRREERLRLISLVKRRLKNPSIRFPRPSSFLSSLLLRSFL